MNQSIKYLLALLVFATHAPIAADSAETNSTAKAVKKVILSNIRKSGYSKTSYCDWMLEMKYTKQYARVVRVTHTGDRKLCKVGIQDLTKKKYRYDKHAKLLRIHVALK